MSDQELSQLLLEKLNIKDSGEVINSIQFAIDQNQNHQIVVGVVKSLQSVPGLIDVDQVESKRWELSAEGKQMVVNGSHEFVIWNLIPSDGIAQPDLMKSVSDPNVAKLGFSKAMSNKWIAIDKSSGKPLVTKKCKDVKDNVKEQLISIQNGLYEMVCVLFYITEFVLFIYILLVVRFSKARFKKA